jgi:endogenous inhibitor of DNA gyrase (YacG/DUF329 family)
MKSESAREMPCPTCKKPASFSPQNAFRPFCSERCKLIDLGAWASEEFKIPTNETVMDDNYNDQQEGE